MELTLWNRICIGGTVTIWFVIVPGGGPVGHIMIDDTTIRFVTASGEQYV